MDTLVFALRDFFEFCFRLMKPAGMAIDLIFIGLISFFTIYWIREMVKNPDKARH
jgi:hypothetical protein